MRSFYTFHCTDNFDIINNRCAVVSVIPFLSFVLFHSFTPAKNKEININIVAYVCMIHISSWTSGLTLMELCINIALGYFDYQNLYGVYKYSIQTPQSHILVTLLLISFYTILYSCFLYQSLYTSCLHNIHFSI